jgi:hypothetical protein
VYGGFQLGEGSGHDLADADLSRVSAIVEQPRQGHFLNTAYGLAVLQHGQLREAGGLQQLDGLSRRSCGRDRHQLARSPAAQQVAYRVRRGRRGQQVVGGQPGVVVELAQIVASGVGAQGHDQVVGRKPLRDAESRRHRRAAGTAHENPLTPRQRPRRMEGLGVTDPHPLIY